MLNNANIHKYTDNKNKANKNKNANNNQKNGNKWQENKLSDDSYDDTDHDSKIKKFQLQFEQDFDNSDSNDSIDVKN
jgi:hypothetical protein